MKRLQALVELWHTLPSTAKVFIYLLVSALLAQVATDLSGLGGLWAKYLLIPINLSLVFLEKDAPAVRAKFKK